MIGRDALHRRLNAVPDAIIAVCKPILEQEAESMVQQMRSIVRVRTGQLQRSIDWTWGEVPPGAIRIGQIGNRKFGMLSITIYAGPYEKGQTSTNPDDAYWARFEEFGTVNQPASPFFYPVFRSNRKRVRSRIKAAITRAMKGSNRK